MPAERPSAKPPTEAERRLVLDGLDGHAERIAAGLLNQFSGWTVDGLETLRCYATSCARLRALELNPDVDPVSLHRELRGCLQLRAALKLEI